MHLINMRKCARRGDTIFMEEMFKEIISTHFHNVIISIKLQDFGGTAWDQIPFPVSVPAHLFLRWGPYNLCTGL